MWGNDPPPPTPPFPPTSSRQILQLYCPDSRAAGAQATKGKGGWGGCRGDVVVEEGTGKEKGQLGDKRGRNRAPLPWFHLCTQLSRSSPVLPAHLAVLVHGPATRDTSARRERCRLALPALTGVCGRGQAWQRGHVAGPASFFSSSRGAVMAERYSCAH